MDDKLSYYFINLERTIYLSIVLDFEDEVIHHSLSHLHLPIDEKA